MKKSITPKFYDFNLVKFLFLFCVCTAHLARFRSAWCTGMGVQKCPPPKQASREHGKHQVDGLGFFFFSRLRAFSGLFALLANLILWICCSFVCFWFPIPFLFFFLIFPLVLKCFTCLMPVAFLCLQSTRLLSGHNP